MKAEEYIRQKSTTIYSGGVNVEKIVSEKDALLALDAARKEMLDEVCSYLFREEYYGSTEFVRRLYEANRVYQPFLKQTDMKDIVIEIDGVRHRLAKGEIDCYKCSIFGYNCCKVSYLCMAFREKHERLHFELENK